MPDLSILASISPEIYVFLIVILFINYQNSKALKTIDKIYNKALGELREAYKDASEQLRQNFKLLNEIYGQAANSEEKSRRDD